MTTQPPTPTPETGSEEHLAALVAKIAEDYDPGLLIGRGTDYEAVDDAAQHLLMHAGEHGAFTDLVADDSDVLMFAECDDNGILYTLVFEAEYYGQRVPLHTGCTELRDQFEPDTDTGEQAAVKLLAVWREQIARAIDMLADAASACD